MGGGTVLPRVDAWTTMLRLSFFCTFLSLMSKGMNGWVVEEEEAWLEI
jgi:hypothetical protein